jgi:hydroxyacylglutathione hydrolase
MIRIKSFVFNPFQENTYILSDETGECLIIDPGCYDASEQKKLEGYIEEKGLKPIKLILTHSHIDHILGCAFVFRRYGLKPIMHQNDLPGLEMAPQYGQMYGIRMEPSPEPLSFLKEGDVVNFGNSKLDVLFTPGHSPGSVTLYSKSDRFLISGDVLFYGSIGRTDLPGGDHDALISSIKNNLLVLDDETIVYSGHGPETDIGYERKNNPFLV